jgi:hypothetical protein
MSRKTFLDIINGSQLPQSYCQNIRPWGIYVGVSNQAVITRHPDSNLMEPGPNLGEVTSALEWCLIPESLINPVKSTSLGKCGGAWRSRS